jgi:hypothetical protein
VSSFFAEAYAVQQGEAFVLQLVSQAARSIPQLTPDSDGLVRVPIDQAEEVFAIFDEAGVDLRVLG